MLIQLPRSSSLYAPDFGNTSTGSLFRRDVAGILSVVERTSAHLFPPNAYFSGFWSLSASTQALSLARTKAAGAGSLRNRYRCAPPDLERHTTSGRPLCSTVAAIAGWFDWSSSRSI